MCENSIAAEYPEVRSDRLKVSSGVSKAANYTRCCIQGKLTKYSLRSHLWLSYREAKREPSKEGWFTESAKMHLNCSSIGELGQMG